MDAENVLHLLRTRLTVSVPVGGFALGELCEATAYATAQKNKEIAGCPVITVAGKLRMPTAPIRAVLGVNQSAMEE
jgi:hypothetical protein